jgi:tight adherence protein B
MKTLLLFIGFFAVFLLILYGLGVIRTLPKSLKVMEARDRNAAAASGKSASLKTVVSSSKIRQVRMEEDNPTLIERIEDALFTSGIKTGVELFFMINIPLMALLGFVLFQGLGWSPVVAFPGAILFWLIGIKVYLARKKNKRRDLFQKDFIDVIATISRSISVGSSLQESFRVVSEEFSGPVQDEFNRMRQDILFGLSPQQALNRAADRIQLSDFDFFTLSVITQIESGGNLGKSMESLRDMILNRYLLLRDLKVKTSSARFQMRFFIGLPIVMAILMYFFSPENIMYFLNGEGTQQGRMLVGWMFLGIIISKYMTKKALDG